MDPVTIFTILGGLLAGGSLASGIGKTDDRPMLVRTVWTSREGDAERWRATELLSERALEETGPLFDLDLAEMWPMVESNVYRVIVLAEMSGRQDRHVVFRAKKIGEKWELDVAFGSGGAVVKKHQLQRINAVLTNMSWIQSMVNHPMEPRAQPLYGIGTNSAVWILDSYLIDYASQALQVGLMDGLLALRENGGDSGTLFYAYGVANVHGEITCAFVLALGDGQYDLVEARGKANARPTSAQAELIETFVDGLNAQAEAGVPAFPATVPERRMIGVDELQDLEGAGERQRQPAYAEGEEEEDDMRYMPVDGPGHDDGDDDEDDDEEDEDLDDEDEELDDEDEELDSGDEDEDDSLEDLELTQE